jgi:hypothetical protein
MKVAVVYDRSGVEACTVTVVAVQQREGLMSGSSSSLGRYR